MVTLKMMVWRMVMVGREGMSWVMTRRGRRAMWRVLEVMMMAMMMMMRRRRRRMVTGKMKMMEMNMKRLMANTVKRMTKMPPNAVRIMAAAATQTWRTGMLR